MPAFTIHSVEDKKGKQAFADVVRVIYKDDLEFICPLDKQIENVFDPSRNPCFMHGSASRWVLKDQHGKLIGRIAAFINERKLKGLPYPVGGIGFFECINDTVASTMLFDTAIQWLRERNMEAVDGPVNFGENDRYWGLMVEGFTKTPFTTNYHKPFYRNLFECYGFQMLYEMFSNEIDLSKQMDERFTRIADRLSSKSNVVIRHASHGNLSEFASYFREIYNDAWRFHEGYTPISEKQATTFANEMKHVLIDKFCPFAFVNGEPAGFIIATPDLNQIFSPFNGRPDILDLLLFKWRSRNNFQWYRKKGILDRGHAIAIGIKPKFQQQGIETAMMMASINGVREMGFRKIELRWAGDFNPKIIRLHKAVGAYPVRKHIILRYMINKHNPVIPPAVIPMEKKV